MYQLSRSDMIVILRVDRGVDVSGILKGILATIGRTRLLFISSKNSNMATRLWDTNVSVGI